MFKKVGEERKVAKETNEIIIGVNIQEEKKQQKNTSKKNKKSKKKSNKKINKKQTKKQNKKQTKNDSKNKKIKVTTPEEQEKTDKKKRKITNMFKYMTLVVLVIGALLLAMFSPLFNIKEIKVKGNEKISSNEIISLSKVKTEQNTFKINKSQIIDKIKENPYIDTVKIFRNLPSTLVIEIEERQPVYLLEYAGSYVYIDKKGYMLEVSAEKLELPILQGQATKSSEFTSGNRLDNQDLSKLSIVYKIMEIAKANEMTDLITRIDIENSQNFKLILEAKDKVAHLGDGSNLLDKMIRIKKIVEQEEGKAGEIFVNMDLNKEDPIFRERV